MVKGISRQVIVVESTEKALFDQAIFILKEGQTGVTDEALLKEAGALLRCRQERTTAHTPVLWAGVGALITGALWLVCAMF